MIESETESYTEGRERKCIEYNGDYNESWRYGLYYEHME